MLANTRSFLTKRKVGNGISEAESLLMLNKRIVY